ncbi:MAG: NAD(P)H-hydrate dehydratase [Spirochaetes bacterium GWF1_31_7]|nr:MAG: NAD(P)H-hydrate dehydratase [Spirochaetes bacterium GWE1_32_154]OHD46508.1 MAG: NAD(P)H-hydrate dehydratase [Spirochaetes bacterium GWE2_31_10]OHD46740.1 MAG: NAD(P)H-hydrate dehydratase [Spirochaetes bacterium GWF1_31_7]OHD83033.1 MAG: NAD(P)H-hydrate dehydratase [Spirochaetes bacterium RIFOXYB1_FULL_32_8]
MPKRPVNSNKSMFGSVLNVAGSINYRGAAVLSSVAVLKVGAGYSTLACPSIVANSITSYIPDIVTIPLTMKNGSIMKDEYKKILLLLPKYHVFSIGSGLCSILSNNKGVKKFFTMLIHSISSITIPVIIDADGLNILSELKSVVLPAFTILTPHPKELSRLLHVETAVIQSDRVRYAKEAAKHYSAVIVLKGSNTIITNGEQVFINTTGNSALAKAGSGDVLTGIIAGLCAQGLSILDAACFGVFLHGLSGDLAKKDCTEYGVLASDLLHYIPMALEVLSK